MPRGCHATVGKDDSWVDSLMFVLVELSYVLVFVMYVFVIITFQPILLTRRASTRDCEVYTILFEMGLGKWFSYI